jgi:hypothetical protein
MRSACRRGARWSMSRIIDAVHGCDRALLGRVLSRMSWLSLISVQTHVTCGTVTLLGGEPHQGHRGFSMA